MSQRNKHTHAQITEVKETHFKIIHNFYPASKFLKEHFKFEVNTCSFCDTSDITFVLISDYSKIGLTSRMGCF